MRTRDDQTPIPDITLERYALGELPADEIEAIDRRLVGDVRLAARLTALRQSNETILAAYPPARFAAEVCERAGRGAGREEASAGETGWARAAGMRGIPPGSPRRRRSWTMVAPAIAVAAVAVLLITLPDDRPPGTGTPPGESGAVESTPTVGRPTGSDVRTKGLTPHINIYRREGDAIERLTDGSAVNAGDVLQIAYVAVADSFGVVVSVDGNGAVTLHHPEDASGSTRLEPAGEVAIPHAYELDDAPAYERFFLVTGDHPVMVTDVETAVRSLATDPDRVRDGSLQLPDELHQYSITLLKGGRQ